jgi:CRP-like cAMP-binding protein
LRNFSRSPIYATYPLFNDINQNSINIILNCFKVVEKKYKKGSYIWNAGDEAIYVGVVVEGQVNIVRDDILGDRIIINTILPSQIFGESYAIAKVEEYPVSVQASTDSVVMLIDKEKLITPCPVSCSFHNKLIKNLLGLVVKKNIKINNRIECITKKNIKQKLIFYLVEEVGIVNKKNYEAEIPFNRKELSEYLNVNRSALSRVLSLLEDEKIISYTKNKFKVINLVKLKEIMDN